MGGPGETINAAMLAAAIRIDAGFKADIGTVVVIDRGLGIVAEKNSARRGIVFRIPIGVALEMDLFKAIGRIAGGAASFE